MSSLYKDYSNIADEVTVLKNPHKGFYYHYVDNGISRPAYRDGIKSDGEIYDFPAMNHIYISDLIGQILKKKKEFTTGPVLMRL